MFNIDQAALDAIEKFEESTGILHSSQNKARLQVEIIFAMSELDIENDKLREIIEDSGIDADELLSLRD